MAVGSKIIFQSRTPQGSIYPITESGNGRGHVAGLPGVIQEAMHAAEYRTNRLSSFTFVPYYERCKFNKTQWKHRYCALFIS